MYHIIIYKLKFNLICILSQRKIFKNIFPLIKTSTSIKIKKYLIIKFQSHYNINRK